MIVCTESHTIIIKLLLLNKVELFKNLKFSQFSLQCGSSPIIFLKQMVISNSSTSYLYQVGRDWGQEEKGTAEDEMAGWCHRLDGQESE